MGFAFIALVVALVVVVASVLFSAIKVVKEYERGVIFRLGWVQGGAKGSRALHPPSADRQDGQDRFEDRDHGRPSPGRHNPR
jgi:regulator of protease activity HflC (stomatin/prohibitin superfamily)